MSEAARVPFVQSLTDTSAASPLPGAGIGWLDAARKENLDAFIAHGLPDTRNEAWKYTALRALSQRRFLPGDMREKVDPYLRPLYDALFDMLPGDLVTRLLTSGEIEVAPLAFMRGRTLAHAYVILDEAQNTSAVQMKMVLTRMGEGTRMVITGDLTQIDLPAGVRCGLRDALETLEGVAGIGVVRLDKRDVVRHPLVARIVDAYEQREAAAGEQRREARRARSPEPPPHGHQPGHPPGHPLGKPTDDPGIVLPGSRPKE